MTATLVVDGTALSEGLVGELLSRGRDAAAYARWEEQVRRVGYCSRPVRLAGHVGCLDAQTGAYRPTYSTAGEPDGWLLKACGQRRATVCPPCSAIYQSDAFQLLAAGLRGGKGVPESVESHPTLFVTFTAPGFGPVHARREHKGKLERCRPRRDETCPHGRRLDCRARHREDDEVLGQPLCVDCFDYEGAVVWNAMAPELWRRTTIYLRRALARAVGVTNKELARLVRVSYSKVVEYQRRGLIHFHAVIRLDAAPPPGQPALVEPPPGLFSAEVLEQAVRAAAAVVSAPAPPTGGTGVHVGWGDQLDIRVIVDGGAQSLSRGAVAGYVAKYATKSTDPLGRLDRRLTGLEDLEGRGVNGHIRAFAATAWGLGEDEELRKLALQRWAHTLGFRGHWMTKSRRYSTTLTALRRARVDWAAGREESDIPGSDDVVEIAEWRFAGVGYKTEGDRWLADSARSWARERLRVAREELATAA